MEQPPFRGKPLNQQVIVITSATQGVGLSTALKAAEKGARLVLGSKNESLLRKLLKRLRGDGVQVTGAVCDVTRFEDLGLLKECAIETFGSIDTWVNSTSSSVYGLMTEIPLEEERFLFETNFWSVRHGCRVAYPELAKHGGVIMNLASAVPERSNPLQGIYASARLAVKAYTDALRTEFRQQKIQVEVCLIRPLSYESSDEEEVANEEGFLYPPERVAEAILACALFPTPEREITLDDLHEASFFPPETPL